MGFHLPHSTFYNTPHPHGKKKALPKQNLFEFKHVVYRAVSLGRDHVVCTRAFFAFADVISDGLIFIEGCIALCLDF